MSRSFEEDRIQPIPAGPPKNRLCMVDLRSPRQFLETRNIMNNPYNIKHPINGSNYVEIPTKPLFLRGCLIFGGRDYCWRHPISQQIDLKGTEESHFSCQQ